MRALLRGGYFASVRTKPASVDSGELRRELKLHPERLAQPSKWRDARLVFVNSMSDLFHEDVPVDFVDRTIAVMERAAQHTYQVLTKRPERALRLLM